MSATIGESFLAAAANFPEKCAVIDGETCLHFAQYAGAALKVAAGIEARGEGEHVALLLPTSDAFAITFFAAMLSGRVPVPLSPLLSAEELSYVVADCGAKTLITTRFFEKAANALGAEVVYAEEFLPECLELAPAKPAPANPTAVVLYTSGTTGKPKGVILSHRNILANVRGCVERFHLGPEHVIAGVLPLFHSFAMTAALVLPATIGASTVLMKRFEPAGTLSLCEKHRIRMVLAIPSMYRAMAKALSRGNYDLSCVELFVSGGEPLGETLAGTFRDEFGIRIYEGYGLTETSPVVAVNSPEDFKALSVGRPLPNVEVRIADDGGRELGPDADGEVWVRGDSVMEGYLNLPDETRAVMTEDAFFRTGDIGRLDSEGFLAITGRKKEMIISSGENIFPGEIEQVLVRHADVMEAAVIGIPHKTRGEAPKAFVSLKDGSSASADDLKAFCRPLVARFKVPVEIEFVKDFPRSATGKILKRRLEKSGPSGTSA